MTLANTHANFGARIFHPKTLDGLAEGIAAHPTLPPRPTHGIDAPGLLAVAAATRAAKREKFSMDRFCGTKCCAIAHFCIAHPGDDLTFFDVGVTLRSEPELNSYKAIARRFCISVNDAIELFSAGSYPNHDEDGSYIGIGREEVASRIEDFIASNEEGGGL